MKTLILFSGGDTPGMNMLLFHLVKQLKSHEVYVCHGGLQGLIDNKLYPPDYNAINKNKYNGGIIIKSSRSEEFMTDAGFKKAIDNIKNNNIEKVIIVGGDGSFKAAEKLSPHTSILFIPATIDNDFPLSDYSLGFYSAVSNANQYINNVKQTFASFDRIGVVEVMGRYCSNIAKELSKQLDVDVLILGKKDLEKIEEKVKIAKQKNSSPLILVRENVVDVFELAKNIQEQTGFETRACVVGYFQRGGNPSEKEVYFAKQFAKNIKKYLTSEDVAIVYKNNKFIAQKIEFNK